MSHSEFIDFCKSRDIKINNISRDFVYVDMDLTQFANCNFSKTIKIPPLSNCRTDIFSGCIYPTLEMFDQYGQKKLSLKMVISEGRIIDCIKILRYHFNLGLKQAKDLYDCNITAWKNEVSKLEY